MPSKARNLDACLETFLGKLTKKGRADVTKDDYTWLVTRVNRGMIEYGYEAHPTKWNEDTVVFIRDELFAHLKPDVARRQMSMLGTYAEAFGNTVIQDMDLEWPRDQRIHVDWLAMEDALTVMDAAKGKTRIVIHLELKMGMRRISVLRLKVQDIGLGYINILGKGRRGGKTITNPFDHETMKELNYYHELREMEIARARAKNPCVAVPDELLIYERAGKLYPYKRSWVDEQVRELSQQLGIHFTNHTLRRTWGRKLYLSGVPLSTISELLGHTDEKTTRLYLGINFDDKLSAMSRAAEFEAALRRAKSEGAREIGGQSGI